MEYLVIILISIIFILLLKLIFRIKISTLRNYKDDEELIKLTDKFPNNVELTKEILKMLNNEKVQIKENLDSETSLYIAVTDTISISTKKNSCARIQTIAHECMHSVQNKTVHIANFIISNLYIVYFFTISILTIFNLISNPLLYIGIFVILGFLQFTIRAFLEIDAMTKAKYLAKEYMEKRKLCTEEEKNKLIKEYENINKIGIPFVVDNLLTTGLFRNLIYTVICIIV